MVQFEDVFEDKENVYIIMELCQNQVMTTLVAAAAVHSQCLEA